MRRLRLLGAALAATAAVAASAQQPPSGAGSAQNGAAGAPGGAGSQAQGGQAAPGQGLAGTLESGAREAEAALGSGGDLASVLGWLHGSNATAIQAGKLGQHKGRSSTVKDLAGNLVSNGTRVEQEIGALAQARGIQLPSAGQQASSSPALAMLQRAKGKAFDTAFLKWLAGSQQRDAAQARTAQASAAKSGDGLTSALLARIVPQLESRASSARTALRALSSTSRQGRSGATSGASSP